MSNAVYSSKSSRKIVHLPHCSVIRRMDKENRQVFEDIEDAFKAGYRLCNCCLPTAVRLRHERTAVNTFCEEKGIKLKLENGVIHVDTPTSRWQIVYSSGKSPNSLHLYHWNTINRPPSKKYPCPVPGFHSQAFHSSTIMGFLQYIYSHDQYRAENPVLQRVKYPNQDKSNLLVEYSDKHSSKPKVKKAKNKPQKGTKRYRKEQKLLKEKERKAAALRVRRLIDHLHTRNR